MDSGRTTANNHNLNTHNYPRTLSPSATPSPYSLKRSVSDQDQEHSFYSNSLHRLRKLQRTDPNQDFNMSRHNHHNHHRTSYQPPVGSRASASVPPGPEGPVPVPAVIAPAAAVAPTNQLQVHPSRWQYVQDALSKSGTTDHHPSNPSNLAPTDNSSNNSNNLSPTSYDRSQSSPMPRDSYNQPASPSGNYTNNSLPRQDARFNSSNSLSPRYESRSSPTPKSPRGHGPRNSPGPSRHSSTGYTSRHGGGRPQSTRSTPRGEWPEPKPWPDILYDEASLATRYPVDDVAREKEAQKWLTNPKSVLTNYVVKITGHMPVYEFETMGPVHNLLHRCKVVVDSEANIVGIGDHRQKKESEKLAALDACYQLEAARWPVHRGLTVQQHGSRPPPPRGDKESKKHVMDYCARYGHLPEFRFTQEGPDHDKVWYCEVELPAQMIVGRGRGRNKREAEQDASADFKEKAEEWQATHGGREDAASREAGLTFNTAKSFIDFYCRLYKFGPPVIEHDATGPIHDTRWKATLVVKGSVIGIGTQSNKKDAEQAAYMDAAIELRKDSPELWDRYNKGGSGSGPPVVMLAVGEETERFLNRLVKDVRGSKELYAERKRSRSRSRSREPAPMLIDQNEPVTNGSSVNSNGGKSYPQTQDSLFLRNKSRALYDDHQAYLSNPRIERFREQKKSLPITSYGPELLHTIESHPVSIVVGSTGCGKTTQLPQMILDDWIAQQRGASCNIIVTQPRRIAAISVAQRVAAERGEALGQTVGYQVRFDSIFPKPAGSILYCTTGVFLRRMHAVKTDATTQPHARHHRNADDERDPLQDVTHIIVDEVHERDMNTDFLLVILRRVMAERRRRGWPEIRIVLMSATMDTDLFATYFGANGVGDGGKSPVLQVPGKIFPVKQWYLEDVVAEVRRMYSPNRVGTWLEHHDSAKYLERERKVAQAAPTISKRKRREEGEEIVEEVVEGEEGSEGAMRKAVVVVPTPTTSATSAPAINWGGGENEEQADAEVPYALMALVIAHIVSSSTKGAILVFLPGWEEIMTLNRALTEPPFPLGVNFNDTGRFRVHMLHSSLPNLSQQEVFEPLPSPEMRKIILATNIAETSITIPDVVYVVDSGKVKEKRYDQSKRMTNLLTTWISQSNMRQRAGRAGRVREGEYFAMMSRQREQYLLDSYSTPEMLRSDLQDICLHIKALDLPTSIAETLEQAIEPPDPKMVAAALENLRVLQALDSRERLTPLGKVLATLPVEPGLGKMVLLGAVFRCLDPVLTIAASMASKDPFVAPALAKREADEKKAEFARRRGGSTESDHLAVLNAYNAWYEIQSQRRFHEANRFCMDSFLAKSGLTNIERVKVQLLDLLEKAGIVPRERSWSGGGFGNGAGRWASSRDFYEGNRSFAGMGMAAMQQQQQQQPTRLAIGPAEYNSNSNVLPLLRALICAGVWPNICVKTSKKTYRTQHDPNVSIHPSSVNYRRTGAIDDDEMAMGTLYTYSTTGTLYSYSTKVKTSSQQVYLRNTTKMDAMAIALFGGKMRFREGGPLIVDDWLRLSGDTYILDLVDELKWVLDRALSGLWERLGEKEAASAAAASRSPYGPPSLKPRYLIDEEDRDTQDLLDGVVKLLERVDEDPIAQAVHGFKRDSYRPSGTNSGSNSRPQSRQDGGYGAPYPTSASSSTAYRPTIGQYLDPRIPEAYPMSRSNSGGSGGSGSGGGGGGGSGGGGGGGGAARKEEKQNLPSWF